MNIRQINAKINGMAVITAIDQVIFIVQGIVMIANNESFFSEFVRIGFQIIAVKTTPGIIERAVKKNFILIQPFWCSQLITLKWHFNNSGSFGCVCRNGMESLFFSFFQIFFIQSEKL